VSPKANFAGRTKRSITKRAETIFSGPTSEKSVRFVGIGASAGGLGAFKELLKGLAGNTGMAFVFMRHRQPGHESLPSNL